MTKTIGKFRVRVSQIFGYVLIIAIILSTSAWEKTFPLIGSILFSIGVILVAIAAFGRLWCSLYVGGFKTNKLVTEGPYSLCRNPLYFCSFLGAAGIGFATETITFAVIATAAFAVYYPLAIKDEESGLEKIHGEEFSKYMSTTPRFFPKLSLLREPSTYTVNPGVFRQDMRHTIWFVWAIGVLEIVKALHNLGLIPVAFVVY